MLYVTVQLSGGVKSKSLLEHILNHFSMSCYERYFSFFLSHFLLKKRSRRKPLIKCSLKNYTPDIKENSICQQWQQGFYRTNISRIINVDATRMDSLQNSQSKPFILLIVAPTAKNPKQNYLKNEREKNRKDLTVTFH